MLRHSADFVSCVSAVRADLRVNRYQSNTDAFSEISQLTKIKYCPTPKTYEHLIFYQLRVSTSNPKLWFHVAAFISRCSALVSVILNITNNWLN